jgi:hypothetical protein
MRSLTTPTIIYHMFLQQLQSKSNRETVDVDDFQVQ